MDDDERAQAQTAEHGEVTLDEVEVFIKELPNEYRFLAIFVYATAASPRAAIGLKVEKVNKLIAKLGHSRAMQQLSNVWIHPDWDLLLPVYIHGRRAALLKRKGILASDEPSQVYLDRNARPFTLEKVNRAFSRLSKKLNLPIPISLDTIACAVAAEWKSKLEAAAQHPIEGVLARHFRSLVGRLEHGTEMHDDDQPIRHTRLQRTVGYVGTDVGDEEVYEGELALYEIDAFIRSLPAEYRELALFVRATAADPEVAINLDVATVKNQLAGLGGFLTMQNLSTVPTHPHWENLLQVQIEGRRASLLRRKGISLGEEPSQVYLDRNAQPMSLKNVNTALARASKRMKLGAPITLETIAEVVTRSSMRKSASAAASEDGYLMTSLDYYLREVRLGHGLKNNDINGTRH